MKNESNTMVGAPCGCCSDVCGNRRVSGTGNKPPAEPSDLTVGRIGIPEVPKLPELTRPETDTTAPAGLDVSLATRPRAPQVLEVLTETGERGKED